MKIAKMIIVLLMAALIPLTLITGCDDDDDDNNDANVRVLHMSYDAPAVDVRFDDQTEIANLNYPESSGYVDVNENVNTITVFPTGAAAATPAVLQQNVDLAKDQHYTVVVLDQLADIDAVVATDDRKTPSDQAKVRFIHAVPDAPAVDVHMGSGAGPPFFKMWHSSR